MDELFKAISRETIDKEIVEIVKDKLLVKYGEEFEVVKIGRRYGSSSSNDTVTTICRSTKNKDVLFTFVLNIDKVHFHDDYYLSLICSELQKELKKTFKENEIEVYPRIIIFGTYILDQKLNLEKFIEKKPNARFLTNLYIKEKAKKQAIKKALDSIREKYPSINMRGNINIVDSLNYEEFTTVFNGLADREDVYIDSKDIIGKYRVEGV